MSHFQLKRRTGRSSAAISRGIDTLVRARLIIVRDSFGVPLKTPSERRRAHSRLNFAINPDITSRAFYKRFAHQRFLNFEKEKRQKTIRQKKTTAVSSRKLPTPSSEAAKSQNLSDNPSEQTIVDNAHVNDKLTEKQRERLVDLILFCYEEWKKQ
jgi:hypothetical protein